jgi:molecular chaperone GrpE
LTRSTSSGKPSEGLVERRASRLRFLEAGKLNEALEQEKARADEYLNRLKYLQADFQNYQRRVEKERGELVKRGNEELILKLLSVVDNLERAVEASKSSSDKEVLVSGVEMVLKQFQATLAEEGLSQIEAVGKPLDPELHEAVTTVETDQYPENIIVRVLRKGYSLNGRVIRPSMVEVAKKRVVSTQDDQAK